jgi:hypothetical protein
MLRSMICETVTSYFVLSHYSYSRLLLEQFLTAWSTACFTTCSSTTFSARFCIIFRQCCAWEKNWTSAHMEWILDTHKSMAYDFNLGITKLALHTIRACYLIELDLVLPLLRQPQDGRYRHKMPWLGER